MSNDISFSHGTLRLSMDFLEIDDRSGGVLAKICIEYLGLRQQMKWGVDGVWIEYSVLADFESQLGDGVEAVLRDMSEYAVVQLQRDKFRERLLINPPNERKSSDGEMIAVDLSVERGTMQSFHTVLKEFAKWW